MARKAGYLVEITPEAEGFYWSLLEYLYRTHSITSASEKANEILAIAMSLNHHPLRGRSEQRLEFLGKGHRFLLYKITSRKQVKIIYFVDESEKIVYITDFFATEMEDSGVIKRNK